MPVQLNSPNAIDPSQTFTAFLISVLVGGVSQRELARRVGISQPVIAHIEAGRARNLELRTLLKIASALNGEVEITIRGRTKRRFHRARKSGSRRPEQPVDIRGASPGRPSWSR